MKRKVYRGQIRAGLINETVQIINSSEINLVRLVENGLIMTLSLFIWGNNLFLYYEEISEEINVEAVMKSVSSYLEFWPGESSERHWVPMQDIFHYNEPQNPEHWMRKQPVEKRVCKLARLKPEMVSSYIFNHYQLQEEQPGCGHKYGIICINENLLFFYKEEPLYYEKAIHKGKLSTLNTPKNWGELMESHFIKWKDQTADQTIWCDGQCILGI